MKISVSFSSVLLLIFAFPLFSEKFNGTLPNSAPRGGGPPTIKTIYPTFTTIEVPGAGLTEVNSINSAGDIVGIYGSSSYDPHQRGFLIRDGNLIRVDYPHAYTTLPFGINDAGIVIGAAGLQHGTVYVGFTYDGTTFKSLRDGSDSATVSYSINNADSIVGGAGTIYGTKGFLENDRTFTVIDFPGNNVYEYATNINNLGEIVGLTDYDAYTYINGQFQNIDVPGASRTGAFGINDRGTISGYYFEDPSSYGFALLDGKYLSFSFPGASDTTANGINAAGQVVGSYYTQDTATYHGFVTSPITPGDFQ